MDTKSSVTLDDAVTRFARLKRCINPNWDSSYINSLTKHFGRFILLDNISPSEFFRLLSQNNLILHSNKNKDQVDLFQNYEEFWRFCYEMGFMSFDLRPILKMDSKKFEKSSIRFLESVSRINYISSSGKNLLENELNYLYTDQRPRMAKWLAHATPDSWPGRPAVDIPKNVQSLLEGRIFELEVMRKNYVIIEEARTNFLFPNCINVGDTVKIKDEFGEESFTILGVFEAKPSEGRISFVSPFGQALLGRIEGDNIQVKVPAGLITVNILSFKREEIKNNEEEFTDYIGDANLGSYDDDKFDRV